MGKIFVAIAGNIGAGKTTFTRLLSERFGWEPHFEKVIENPYLPDFYRDMPRWAFHSQIFFLTHRFRSLLEIQRSERPCVQDRTIYEDAEIFAANLHRQGFMNDRDFRTYRELYETILQSLRQPDLIVYLRASPWTLVSRIRTRGREFEKTIDPEYLLQLHTAYEQWVKRISQKLPLLIVETDEFDVYRDTEWREDVFQEIARCAGYRHGSGSNQQVPVVKGGENRQA